MNSAVEEARQSLLQLLDQTRRETRALLSRLDPQQVVHTDERAWRVRDVIGHLGVWNEEAARSLSAYAAGGEYGVLATRGQYDDYNGPAADARRAWNMDAVWSEYETAHDDLQKAVEAMPVEKWDGELVFPWHERGTIEQLIRRMMKHERTDHCDLIDQAATGTPT